MQRFVSWYWQMEAEDNVLVSNEMWWGDKGPLTEWLGLLHEAIHYKFFCSREKRIKEFY